MSLLCRIPRSLVAFLLLLVSAFAGAQVQSEDSSPKGKKTFQDVIVARQKDLLRDAASYAEQNPEASDLDDAFAWSFDAARRFGLEADKFGSSTGTLTGLEMRG